ncbi:MAG: alpha/beta hydrolase [Spirochaetae bacterium HGW-Spirochaetae-1]|jgi:pimeloyl-ACP methyl ester carboxylesterase|nr:MAG: alpha/beta hydrolase [Spirochaetae bacterium HGW-Spirochaetae-1]
MMMRVGLVLVFLFFTFISSANEASVNKSQSRTGLFRFNRVDQTFVSQGDKCMAWLYLPKGVVKPPVVIMAHGFGGQRWMRLPAYAERFARRGMAVFLFDYRGFNDSEGLPRNYINPSRHLDDWEAAIRFVRTLDIVDAKCIALWGTSFSAGHVTVIASRDPGISAIVAQVPFTDGITTAFNYSLSFQIRAIYHGLWDIFDAVFTDHRHNVLITSTPDGEFGMMSTADAWTGMMNLLGSDAEPFGKDNFCPANIVFTLTFYRPISDAAKITCPALVIGAENDSLFPPDGPRKAAKLMKNATYIGLPMGHFEPYVGEPFEKLVVQMEDFLQANLGKH